MAKTADIKTQPFYLKKAKLKGYKSIKDAEVEFCDGLNIIIGKNASGKSNLLEILFKTLKLNTDSRFPTNSEITLHGLKDLKISASYVSNNGQKLSPKTIKINKQTDYKFLYDGQKIEGKPSLNANFIKFNIPDSKSYPIISLPFDFKYYLSNHFADIDVNTIKSKFSLYIISRITNNPLLAFFSWPLDLNEYKNKFVTRLDEEIKNFNNLFEGLIPIEEIRFNPYVNIHFDEESEILTFGNLFIEHKVNGNWLPYSSLSDGTKRLFYIISEIYAKPIPSFLEEWSVEWFNIEGENMNKNIVFIEEPELGIHPHQLHQLMTFIKEQSEEKQIILSTHSPMVLDVLGKDDLRRIIIASNDDPKKGSQFRHLTEAEIEKAKSYMNDKYLYLSDYWKHSDLE